MMGYAVACVTAIGWIVTFASYQRFRSKLLQECSDMNQRWRVVAEVVSLHEVKTAILQGRDWSIKDEALIRLKEQQLEQLGVDLAALGLKDIHPPRCPVSEHLH